MTWARGSTRKWRQTRNRVIHRANHQCEACGTNGPLEVDHIINLAAGGTDRLDNLQALCRNCHAAKTKAEAATGRATKHAETLHTEAHPGLISPGASQQ